MEVTAETLNSMVEFDHPFRVNDDGTIADVPGVYAPECYVPTDADGQCDGPPETWKGWSFVDGWSGQYRYSGPIMHASEYLGGRMAQWVLETPGVYVVCAVETLDDHEDAAGWALLTMDEAPVTMDEAPAPDTVAMDAIYAILNGTEWEAATIEYVAEIVERTGRAIASPDDAYPLTCHTCGRVGNRDDGIWPGGPCQEPCPGTVVVA